jgi:hypothetical protein
VIRDSVGTAGGQPQAVPLADCPPTTLTLSAMRPASIRSMGRRDEGLFSHCTHNTHWFRCCLAASPERPPPAARRRRQRLQWWWARVHKLRPLVAAASSSRSSLAGTSSGSRSGSS